MINFPPDLLGSDILVNAKREELRKRLAAQAAMNPGMTIERDPSLPQDESGNVEMLDSSYGTPSPAAIPQSLAVQAATNAAASPPSAPQSVIPQARAAQGGGYGAGAARGTAAPAKASPYAEVDAELATLRGRRDKQMEDPDYGPLKEQMRGRAFDAGNAAIGVGLAGIGPDWMQGMAAPMAQRVAKMSEPMKVEGGEIDNEGNVRLDPGFKRTQQMEFLQKRINELEGIKTRAVSAEQHQEILREQMKLRQQQASIAAADRAARTKLEERKLEQERWVHVADPVSGEVFAYDRGAKDPKATMVRLSDLSSAVDPATGLPNPPKLTEAQQKSFNAGNRLATGLPQMQAMLSGGYEPSITDVAWQANMGQAVGVPLGYAASSTGKNFFTIGRDVLAGVLRKESGANVTKQEWDNYAAMWLPWPTDDARTRATKMQLLENQFRTIGAESGPAGNRYIQMARKLHEKTGFGAAPQAGAGPAAAGGVPDPVQMYVPGAGFR